MATHTDHTRQPSTVARQSEIKLSRKTKKTEAFLAQKGFERLMREVNGR